MSVSVCQVGNAEAVVNPINLKAWWRCGQISACHLAMKSLYTTRTDWAIDSQI